MGKIEAVGNFSVVGKWEEVVRVGEAMGILILIFGVDFVWRFLNRRLGIRCWCGCVRMNGEHVFTVKNILIFSKTTNNDKSNGLK